MHCHPVLAGVGPLDGLLHHLLTPAFLLPQALNLGGSVLFAAALSSCDISVAAPVANGGCARTTCCNRLAPGCHWPCMS